MHSPGTVIQASDRRYIVGRHGELRVLDYSPRSQPEPYDNTDPMNGVDGLSAPVEEVTVIPSTSPENFSAAVECGSLTDLPPAA